MVKDAYYCPDAIDEYDIPVASNFYLRHDYADSVWHEIITAPLLPTRGYRYSDLGFYIVRIGHRSTWLTHQSDAGEWHWPGRPLKTAAHLALSG